MDRVKSKDKLPEVEIARGIGIALVVIGHCIPNVLRIKQLIYLFHMPLFFFLSGYCFRSQTEETVLCYAKKKVKSLYLPFVFCNCFALTFHQIFCEIGVYPQSDSFASVGQFTKYFIQILMCVKMEDIVAPLWFLPILMLVSLSNFIAQRIARKYSWSNNVIRIGVLVVYIVAFLVPRTGFSRAFILWALGLFVFNVGCLFREKKVLDYVDKKITAGFSVILLLGAQVCDINIIQMRIGNPITYALFGVVGISVVMKIAKAITGFLASVLAYMGNKSLCILEWHYYVFLIITSICQCLIQKQIQFNNTFVSYNMVPTLLKPCLFVGYVVFGICIPLLVEKLLHEMKEKMGRKKA